MELRKDSAEYKALRRMALDVQGKPATIYGCTYDQREDGANIHYIQRIIQHCQSTFKLYTLYNILKEMRDLQDKTWNDQRSVFTGKYFSEKLRPRKIIKKRNIQTADGIIIQNLILAGYSSKYANWIAIGTGTEEATPGQTSLGNEVTRLPCLRDGWHVPAADILQTGVIYGAGTPTNTYTEFGGVTGEDAEEDFLCWKVVLPSDGYISHEIGKTIILLNHIQETIALS